MENQSPYLTLSEAAHYSRYSVRQIERYLKAGKLKRYGHGRRPLVRREDLEEFLSPDANRSDKGEQA